MHSPTPQGSSYWKRSLRVTLNKGRQLYLLWTQQKEKWDELIYKYQNILYFILTICIQAVLKERIHKYIPTARTIHILFNEQAICRRGTKFQKACFISVGCVAMWHYYSLAESKTMSLLVKDQRWKEIKNRFLRLSCGTVLCTKQTWHFSKGNNHLLYPYNTKLEFSISRGSWPDQE